MSVSATLDWLPQGQGESLWALHQALIIALTIKDTELRLEWTVKIEP